MTDQFKKLKTVLNNPDLLTSISIKELKQLRRLCTGANLMVNSGPATFSSTPKISPLNGIPVDPQKLETLKNRLNQLIVGKINSLQVLYFSVGLLLHLLLLFGILLYRKMEILPWYLVFGSFGIMMMLRVLVPSTKEISGVPLYYQLRCRHLIFSCIPMSVLVVLVIKSENLF